MNEFFTWAILVTYAGATAATGAITQLCKDIGFLKCVPTQLFSYIAALTLLMLATAYSGELTMSSGVLCCINAVVVSMASNGAFEVMNRIANGK